MLSGSILIGIFRILSASFWTGIFTIFSASAYISTLRLSLGGSGETTSITGKLDFMIFVLFSSSDPKPDLLVFRLVLTFVLISSNFSKFGNYVKLEYFISLCFLFLYLDFTLDFADSLRSFIFSLIL